MQINGVEVVHGRVVTANIETSSTLPTDKLSDGRIVYLTQLYMGNVPGLYVYSTGNWEVVTNTGYITGVNPGVGLLGGGNSGTVTLDVDTSVIATVASLNSKLDKAGGTMTGDIDLGSNSIINLATPVNPNDAVNKDYADSKIDATGGTMTGTLDMSNNIISNVAAPTSSNQATNKQYVDDAVASIDVGVATLNCVDNTINVTNIGNDYTISVNTSEISTVTLTDSKLSKTGGVMTGDIDMDGNSIIGVATPVNPTDVANKDYVDSANPTNYPVSVTNSDGTYFVVVDSLNDTHKLTKSNINISGFNNDSNFITSTLTSSLNYTPDTGDVVQFDGSGVIIRPSVNSLGLTSSETTVIAGGSNAFSSISSNSVLTNENIIIGADDSVIIYNNLDGLFANRNQLIFSGSTLSLNGNQVWHQGNDGDGSGLDADLIDGIESSQFMRTDVVTPMSVNMDIGNNLINNVANPVGPSDAATKSYVDSVTSDNTFDDGTVSAPSITFANELVTGLYRPGGNQIGITVNGVNRVNISDTAIDLTLPVRFADGSQLLPSLTFGGDTDTGIYHSASNEISFTTNAVTRASIYDSGLSMSSIIYAIDGSANTPSITFNNDSNTGLYSISSNQLGVAVNGIQQVQIDSIGINISTGSIFVPNGNASAPSYTFTNDTNTGLYSIASDSLGVSTNGILRITIDGTNSTFSNTLRVGAGSISDVAYGFTGQTGIGMYRNGTDLHLAGSTGMILGASLISLQSNVAVQSQLRNSNGSFTTPSYSFTNDLNTGMYRSSSQEIGFATNSIARVIMSNTQTRFRGVDVSMEMSAVVQSTDGLATRPSYGFAGEVNTGVYKPSNGVLGFSTLGTQRMTISSSGIDVNSLKITSLATPTTGTDAANKAYVDSAIAGLSWKSAVKVATTADIILSGTQTIDGIAVVAADRVLVKNQSTASQNGIYVVSAGAWTRATDFDQTSPIDEVNSAAVFVMQGTVNADCGFTQTAVVTTVGTDSMNFVQFSSINSYTQGTGISISGQTISLDTSYTDGRYVNTLGDVMTGVLSVIGGNASAPGLSFSGDTDTGLYSTTGNFLALTSGGTPVLTMSSVTGNISALLPVIGVAGSAAIPSYSFAGAADTGMYSSGANELSFATTGTQRVKIDSTGNLVSLGRIQVENGTPVIVVKDSNSNGITQTGWISYHNSSSSETAYIGYIDTISTDFSLNNSIGGLNITAGTGNLILTSSNNIVASARLLSNYSGTSSLPNYSFNTDQTSGLYGISAGTLGLSTSGTMRLSISTTALTSTLPVSVPVGLASAPSINFSGDTNTGFYNYAADVIGFAAGGQHIARITTQGFVVDGSSGIRNVLGTASVPAYSFSSDISTGMYSSNTNEISFATGGNNQVTINSTNLISQNYILTNVGSASTPSYSFIGDSNTGMYLSATDEMAFSSGGVKQAIIYPYGMQMYNTLYAVDGLNSVPAYSFASDFDTGMYLYAANTLGFATDGVTKLTIDTTRVYSSLPIYHIDGTAGSPSIAFNSDTDTGMYRISSGVIGFTAAGALQVSIDSTGMDLHNNKITQVATPTTGTDAANKAYVDSIATGLDLKSSVRAATTANVTLSGVQVIDGVSPSTNDRILVKNQTTASENGIYDYSAGAWTRSSDADNSPAGEVTSGMFCFVEQGTINAGRGFVLTTVNPITLGITSLNFTQFSSSSSYTQGTGISISGQTISLDASYTDTRYINTSGDSMTGVLSIIRGTVATPGLNFAADTGTGIYQVSDGDLNIAISGVVKVSVTSGQLTTGTNVQIVTDAGTPGAPSYTFSGDADTGMYKSAADQIAFSCGGVARLWVDSLALNSTVPYVAPVGSVGNPSFTFNGDTDTGMYKSAANEISFATGGVSRFSVTSSGIQNLTPALFNTVGTAASPSYTFTGVTDMGMYSLSSSSLGFATNGAVRFTVDATWLALYTTIGLIDGSAAVPAIRFISDTDTGIYGGPNEISFSVASTSRLTINTSGLYTSQPIYVPDSGTPALPGYSFNNGNANTGMYLLSSGILGFSTAGTQRMTVSSSGLNLNGNKIIDVATPTATTDAANKAYVDSVATGLDLKASVRAATTANVTLSGVQVIDGVSPSTNDRILVKNQTTASENGIYDYSAGAWTRSSDADNSPAGEVTSGMFCFVEQGTINAGRGFVLTTVNPITLGTTSLSFTQFSSSSSYIQGTGISISGQTVALDTSYTDTRYINTAGDTMTGGLQIVAGTSGAPALSFAGNTNTGIYSAGTNQIDFASNAVQVATIHNTGLYAYVPVVCRPGTTGAPGYTFEGDTDTGMYSSAVNRIDFTSGASTKLSIATNGIITYTQVLAQDGSSAAPSYSFSSDQDTGITYGGTDTIAICTAGAIKLSVSANAVTSTQPYYGPNGTAGEPTYSFTNEPTTGLHNSSAGTLSVSILGTTRVAITSTEVAIGGLKLTNVATPTVSNDGATKGYVDAAISSLRVQIIVNQSSHGFTSGTPIYFNGAIWIAAQANANTTISTHIVESIDANNFYAVNCGNVTTSGLTAGSWYFTSESTVGTLTTTEPVTGFSNPVGQALSTTILMVMPLRAQGV